MAAGSEVGRTEFGIYANRKPFDQAMNSLQSQADSIGKSIAKKLTVGLSVAGLTKFAKDCLYAGSKLNAMRSMTSAAFPSMTKEVQAFANNAAGSFGLSEKMALQYSATLGSMARGMGFTEKQAMQMSTAIAALSGDVASYYSMSQDEAFGKLQAIFTGETESLKSLGVIMTQSALDQYAMANGFGRTTSAMTEQEKVVLRYQFVMSQLNLAQGDFMRTQSAWGNQVKILRMRFAELQAQLGQGLINILKPAIKALNFFMGKLIQVASVFNAFIARITGATKKKGGVKSFASSLYDIGKASKGVGGNLGGISGKTGKMAKGAKKASKAVKALQRELMGFDKINKLSKKDTASGAGGGAGGTGGGAGGLGDIGGYAGDIDGLNDNLFKFDELSKKITGSKIWKALGKVVTAVIRLIKAIGKALAPVGQWIWEHLIKPFGKLLGMGVVAVLEGIAGAINLVALFVEKHPKLAVMIMAIGTALLLYKKLGGIMGILLGVNKGMLKLTKVFGFFTKGNIIILALTAIALAIGYIYQNWDKIKKTKFGKALIIIGNVLKKVGETLKTLGGALKTKLIGAFNKLKPILKFVGKLIWNSIVVRFKLVAWVVKKAWGILKKVGAFFKGAFKKAVEAGAKPVAALKDTWAGIKNKTLELKAKVSDKIDDVKEWASGLGDNLQDLTVDIKAKVATKWDDIKGAWSALTDNVKDKVADMKAKVGNTWDSIKSAWTGITGKIKDKTASMKAKVATTWNGIKKTWNNLMGHFKDKSVSIKVGIKKAAAKGWNAFAKKVNAMKAAHPKIFKAVPKLPTLAQGGWVSKNTPQLAVIGDNRHENEIVSPDSKLEAMARQAAREAGGGTDPQVIMLLTELLVAIRAINTDVYLDGKVITRAVVQYLNQQTRTTGRSPLIV